MKYDFNEIHRTPEPEITGELSGASEVPHFSSASQHQPGCSFYGVFAWRREGELNPQGTKYRRILSTGRVLNRFENSLPYYTSQPLTN
jgi:hypothetical protein